MISILDPRFMLALVVWTASVAFIADHRGEKRATQAAALREARADAAAATTLASVTENVREKESLMVRSLHTIAVNHQREVSNEQTKINALRADVRSGAMRLSIAASACHPNTASADSTATAGDRAETRAELMPSASDALIGIVADGNRGILRANACADAYESVRAELAKQSR
jgi:hypothetical protein